MRTTDKARNDKIVEKFKNGMTLEAIGDEYGVSRQRIQQILQANGLSRASGGLHKRRSIDKDAIASLVNQGLTITQIAKVTSRTTSVVAKVLKELGIAAHKSADQKYGSKEFLAGVAEKSESLRQMSKTLGFNEHSLGAYLKRKHPDILRMVSNRPTVAETEKRKDEVSRMLKDGASLKDIASALGLRLPTLQAWLKYNQSA